MTPRFLQLPPLALYIHVPWCVRKCPYCDFNSHEQKTSLPEAEYVAALLNDLDLDLPGVQGRSLHSIFIGGGTPSLFSADAYDQLFTGIRQRIPFECRMEITMEANPGTVEQGRFTDYRQAGINRLSLGIQSFSDHALQALGRIHGREEALLAVDTARQAGFENINLDLMFGLPDQDIASGLSDLEQALSLQPAHLSWYQLTLEPNTVFHRYPPSLPDDDNIAGLQLQGQELLAQKGYQQYETSAYALENRRCAHNLNYWRFGDYLGIGAGAHGKLTAPDTRQVLRTRKSRQPAHYLAAINPCVENEHVPEQELSLEFMMNAMRLVDGFTTELYENRTGLPWSTVSHKVNELAAKGLMEQSGKQLRPSPQGRLFLNEILLAFMTAA